MESWNIENPDREDIVTKVGTMLKYRQQVMVVIPLPHQRINIHVPLSTLKIGQIESIIEYYYNRIIQWDICGNTVKSIQVTPEEVFKTIIPYDNNIRIPRWS